MSVPSVQPEKAADPGLIIIYDSEAVHVALGQPDSPVIQGATQAESVEAFKRYVFDVLMLTPWRHALTKSMAFGTVPGYDRLLSRTVASAAS